MPDALAEKYNALKPVGDKQTISLAVDGKAVTAIVVPVKASDEELQAAEELKKNLEQITGATFNLVKDNTAIAGTFLSVGNTAQANQTKLAELARKLSPEGIAVKLVEKNIYLLGGSAGIMNAVMAFLEEDVGCRWYSHQWKYIPHDPNFRVEVIDRVSNPDFMMRFVFTAHEMSNDPTWTRHNRVMKWNYFNHVDGWFCHTYAKIRPLIEIETRPDLFAIDAKGLPINTQICPTHPENVKSAQEQVISALKANKRKDAFLISISENDGSTGYCHCDRCEKINKAQGTPIAAHLTLVNKVAKAIIKDFPDIKVDFLVYSKDFKRPPLSMKMEPNVAMWYCTSDLNNYQKFRDDKQAIYFQKWKKTVSTVYIWEYGLTGPYFQANPSLFTMADNLRYWKENNVDGVMDLEVYGCLGGDQQALRAWIFSKLMWNTSLDPDKLARDFCDGVFGDASDEMYEYYQLVNAAGKSGKSIENFYGEAKFIKLANSIFNRAFTKADKSTNNELRHRIEVNYVTVAVMEMDAIFQAYPANKNNFPQQRYHELLEQIKSITTREKMTNYRENRGIDCRITEWSLLDSSTKNNGALRIHSIDGTLYDYPTTKDSLATKGMACRLPCTGNWLVQWHFPVNLCIPGQKYQLRAQLRKELNGGTGPAALVGIHCPENPEHSFSFNIESDLLIDKEYQWFNIGKPFLPEKGNYVWFAAEPGSGIGGLYVNEIELIPQRE
jgi:hypothetical protein